MSFRRPPHRRVECERTFVEQLQRRVLLAGTVPGAPVLPLNPQGAFITNPFDPFPRPRATLSGKKESLYIFGTFGDDEIIVRVGKFNGANRLHLFVNERQRMIKLTDVKRLTIIGDFANDSIRIEDPDRLLAERKVRILGDSEDPQFFGNDTITGSNGKDTIDGGPGDDVIDARGGNDVVMNTGSGMDTVNGGNGNDTISDDLESPLFVNDLQGGNGNDSITGNFAIDLIQGGPGNDTLSGEVGADTLVGGDGDDILLGGSDGDSLFGGNGNDGLFGDRRTAPSETVSPVDNGADVIYGGPGDDSIWGEGGADELFGEEGNDTLLGHFGDDRLSGGPGRDYLNGHEGRDRIVGGVGRDLFNLIDFTNPSGQTDFKLSSDNPNTRPSQATRFSEELPIEV